MYNLRYDIVGKSGGDFRPYPGKLEDKTFLYNIESQLWERGIQKVFSPHCSFTTNISRLGDENQEHVTNWLIRTAPGFDGGIVTEPGTAIAIFNADCPVIILFDKLQGRLAMLHAGFRCLVSKIPREPNIIVNILCGNGLDTNIFDTFIGLGAGPCCYGVNNYIDELNQPGYRSFLSRADKGPRIGQHSLDLVSLAQHSLIYRGVRRESITLDTKCTACAGRENGGQGDYHSNIYGDTGRNLVLAWFTK